MGLTRIRAEQISDIDYKQAVRVITLSNITLTGGAPSTVDGVSLVTGDRVLVNGQSNAAQNGLYQVQTVGAGSNGTWVRTSDGNEDGEIQPGMVVMVTQGTQYADTPWKLTTNGEIIIGTTELTFAENYSLAFGNIVANGTAVLANTVSGPVSFAAGDNIAITGNNTTKTVTFAVTGITTSRIANGTSNVDIATANGNVTVGVAGSEVAEFSTVGQDLTGALTVSGNTNIGSGLFFVNTSSNRIGVGTATPDYPFEIETTGTNSLLVLTRTDGAACFIEGQASRSAFGSVGATPLALAYNSLAVVTIGAGGAITVNPDGGNPYTLPIADGNANELLATDGAGNVDFTATPSVTTLTASGNITGGNLTTAGLISATGNITGGNLNTGAQVVATGNITGGNITTAGSVTATGNVAGGNLTTGAQVVATGNVTGGNLTTAGRVDATGNVSGGNLTTAGAVTGNGRALTSLDASNLDTGTVPSGRLTGSYSISVTSAITAGTVTTAAQPNITSVGTLSSLTVTGNVAGGNLTTGAQVVATGNVTGGNLVTAGRVVATGNVTGGNLTTAGRVDATGNITGGNLSGTLITGTLTTAAQPNVTSIGTLSSLTVVGPTTHTGNIDVTGNINVTGNLNYSNVTDLVVGDPLIFIGANNTGNLVDLGEVVQWNDGTAQYGGLVRDASDGVWKLFGNVTSAPTTTVNFANALYQSLLVGPLTASSGSFSTTLSVTGNANVGNLTTAGLISATGNITGGNLLPPSDNTGVVGTSALTWNNGQFTNLTVDSTMTVSGTLNVRVAIDLADGDILRFGTSDDWEMYHSAGSDNFMDLNTGNLLIRDDGTVGDPTRFTFGRTTGHFTATGNVTGGNLITAGLISATGNITGGNLTTAGTLSATTAAITGNITTGNILTDGYFFANGTPFTSGGTPGGSNTQVQFNDGGVFGATAGLTFDKVTNALSTTGSVSATGNITGGNLSGTSIAGTLTTAAQTNITSVGTLGSLAVTGNTTSGNFIGTLNGSGANVTAISATNISSGTLAQARLANASVTLGSTALTLGSTVTTVAGLSSVTSTTFVGALTGAATTAATVTTAAQPNITSVGTLTSVTVTGNVAGGNLTTGAQVVATGNVTGGNLTTAGRVDATGNITGGNILGNGAGLTGINVFSNISVSGGNSVVADSISDTLTLVAGDGITITANATADTITFEASGGGGGTPGGSNTQVQFNDGGVFGGTAGFTFDKVTNAVSTSGVVFASFFSNPKTISSVVETEANTNNLLIGPVTVANVGNIVVDDTSTLTVL